MDALELLKESARICRTYLCNNCPVKGKCLYNPNINHIESKMEDIVSAVEQWSKEHPIVTNAGKFEEVFGRPPKFQSGDWYCPPIVTEPGCVGLDCNICRKWWEEPYKEQTVVKGGEV